MKGFKINNQQKETILNQINFTKKTNQKLVFFFAKTGKMSIHIYSNNTILLQGDENEINIFLQKYQLNNSNNKSIQELKVSLPYFGGDESGVGDLFGPIVITIFYANKETALKCQSLQISDSKQLNTKQIKEVATVLMEEKEHFVTTIISNSEFNQHFAKDMNLKELLTFYYVKTLVKIVNKHPYKKIVIDGYVGTELFKKYCQRLDERFTTIKMFKDHFQQKDWQRFQQQNLSKTELITKAENQFFAVGAASIISRFVFLQEIDKIEKSIGKKVLLGAHQKVKQLIQKLKANGVDISQISKTGYKGVNKPD